MAARRVVRSERPPSAAARLLARLTGPRAPEPDVSKSMERAVKLWGFNQWLIARFVLLRRDLGLMEINVNNRRRVIYARRTDMGISKLAGYYIRECRYTPFFWAAGIDPFKRVELGGLDELQNRPLSEVARALNAEPGRLKRAAKKHGSTFMTVVDGSVRFEPKKFDEFKLVIERITRLGERAEELSHKCIGDGYRFSLDGEDDAGKINQAMFREMAEIVEYVEGRVGVQSAVPVEVNEMLSFQGSLDAEMARSGGNE